MEDRYRLEHLLALLDAQKGHKAGPAARKAKDNAMIAELSAPDVDILRMRIESLQSQLTEQVGYTKHCNLMLSSAAAREWIQPHLLSCLCVLLD